MKFLLTTVFLIGTIVLIAILTDNVDFALKCFFLLSLTALTIVPLLLALLFSLKMFFDVYKKFVIRLLDKAAKDKDLEDTLSSFIYFFSDMAPSISSVSFVAFFVATEASVPELVVMFFFGLVMKYLSRKLARAYYTAIKKRQGKTNDRTNR
jgi:hypothetical protein